ncbi:ketopantoate reductase family protein [Roseiarcus sp.]|uniref:ketopantoate reductase family protein n=1 Tax=Roseiarcus sp. TaxID=1969460 RepID=UPI003F99D597
MKSPRIAVVGAGANGAGIGADLARAGLNVAFIEQWPAHVEAMRKNGVQVVMPDETQVTPVRVHHVCEVASLRETYDIVFVAVKAYDTRWACELIKPLVEPDGLVVGLQNGMTIDDVAAIVGPERTMGAVIEVTSNLFEPGVVVRQTPPKGSWFAIGAVDPSAEGREDEVAQCLRHAGTVEISEDIRSAKWMKLVVNAAEFLPSAILGLPLAEAIDTPGIREIMAASGVEAVHTALALGRRLVSILGKSRVEANDPDQYAMSLLDAVLSKWTLPDTRVAVLQDWMKGRRGEGDDINGLIVRERRRLGGRAPVNESLIEIAARIERGELAPAPSNADLLRSLVKT